MQKLQCFSVLTLCVVLASCTFVTSAFANKQHDLPTGDTPKDEEIIVIGRPQGDFTVITDNARKLTDMPGALGDPLSAVFALPGVVASDPDGGEPAVRGSSPRDNLYLVDLLPAGYIFHEFSNSIFSEFIIQDFNLYSAGFGAEYANVTGAVFDIRLRDPKHQEFSAILDASLLRSGIFLESGVTENTAFYFSARKSLIHLLIPDDEEEDGVRLTDAPQDEDYQFKYQWKINNHKITLSSNGATDTAGADFGRESDLVRSNPDFEGDASLEKSYFGHGLSYQYLGDNGALFDLAAGATRDRESLDWGDDFFEKSDLDTVLLSIKSRLPIGSAHTLYAGGDVAENKYVIRYDQILFVCTEFDPDCSLNRRERIRDTLPLDFVRNSFYIGDRILLAEKFEVDLGLQWHANDYTNESFTHPRVALFYHLNNTTELSAKYGRYDRLPDLEILLPELGNPDLASQRADHQTLGIKQLFSNGWSWNLELYYKTLKNLPLALGEDDADAEQLYVNDVEGEAFGADLLVNKEKTGRWYGWMALSVSDSRRTNLRTDQTREYFLDTPLVFNWVMNYAISPRLDIGWRWQIRSGPAFSPIIGVQTNPVFEDAVLPVYGEPYSERLPTYSRLDLRLKWQFAMGGRDTALIVDVINVLNRQNVTERTLDYDRVQSIDDPVATEDSVSTGIIPTLGLRITF